MKYLDSRLGGESKVKLHELWQQYRTKEEGTDNTLFV
jgi:hypothetical protein